MEMEMRCCGGPPYSQPLPTNPTDPIPCSSLNSIESGKPSSLSLFRMPKTILHAVYIIDSIAAFATDQNMVILPTGGPNNKPNTVKTAITVSPSNCTAFLRLLSHSPFSPPLSMLSKTLGKSTMQTKVFFLTDLGGCKINRVPWRVWRVRVYCPWMGF